MKKIKLALIIFSPIKSGAESVVIEMIKKINRNYFELTVITNNEIVNYFDFPDTFVFDVGSLYNESILDKIVRKIVGEENSIKLLMARKREKVEKFLLENNIQIIHTNLRYDHYLVSILKLNNLVKVMTIHGALGMDHSRNDFSHNMLLKIFNSMDCIISACNYFINLIGREGGDVNKTCIVENGIDFDALKEINEHPMNDDKLHLVYLGGDRVIKGWDILIDAMEVVVYEYKLKNLKLHILGHVSPNSELLKRIEQKKLNSYVEVVGYVTNNEHLKYFSKCQIYVLPSYSEGIANTLMEAMGMHKCIIATKVGGTPEIVKHLENGYLCETNPQSLAEGIRYFLENEKKIKEIEENNQEKSKYYLWDNITLKYEDLYKKMVSEKKYD